MDFNSKELGKFDTMFDFVPLYERDLYGDDGLKPLEDFFKGDSADKLSQSVGNLEAQCKAMVEIADEYYGQDFDFITLMSKSEYFSNLEGTDSENIDGGKSDWDYVLICAYSGYAPSHQCVGFEVAGKLQEKPVRKPVRLECGW